jgi:hypothetical protein
MDETELLLGDSNRLEKACHNLGDQHQITMDFSMKGFWGGQGWMAHTLICNKKKNKLFIASHNWIPPGASIHEEDELRKLRYTLARFRPACDSRVTTPYMWCVLGAAN